MQQLIGKRLQNPEKTLNGGRIISYDFDGFTRLNFPERLRDSQKRHRDDHASQIQNVVDWSFQGSTSAGSVSRLPAEKGCKPTV
jgi:hypothetical protein